jgi:2'-5' RNA ligase
MAGIVSLLDDASEQSVRALWAELDRRYDLRVAAQRVPYPHFSYHVAEDYELARLSAVLAEVAARTQPFSVTLTGLGAFEAPVPVLYLAVERTPALLALHRDLWQTLQAANVADISRGISPLYAPESWVPHVTLAMLDLTLERLRAIQCEWTARELRREVRVTNLTLLYEMAGHTTHEPIMRYALGRAADS